MIFRFARDFRDRFQVNQLQQRIARRFDPNHARVWFDCALEIFRVGQIDVGKIKVRRAAPHSIEQSKRAAVKIVARDDMRAAVEQLQHGRHRQPGRMRMRIRACRFPNRQCTFRRRAGWD